MSRQAIREVTYYSEGKTITCETDIETARQIGEYNDIRNKINSFTIKLCKVPGKQPGFIREQYFAQSQSHPRACPYEESHIRR